MKDWWKSKTLWVNVIAIASIIIRSEYGLVPAPIVEIEVLGAINFLLRLITKEELNW